MKKTKEKQVIGPTEAIVSKLTTTLDGGMNLTINIPASEKEHATELLNLALSPKVVLLTLVIPND